MAVQTATSVEDIDELFRLRRSGRAYDPARHVSEGDLAALFEAARWAPSAANAQPWRYIYAQKTSDPKGFSRLFDLLNPNNQEWAQYAPVLLLCAAVTVRQNAQGELVPYTTALHDLGLANMSIMLEAVHRGLMAHIVGGFNAEAAREFLPEHTQPVVMMAIGYPGDTVLLSENNRSRESAPRTRKPVDEIVSGVK
jgi:nitroreductase